MGWCIVLATWSLGVWSSASAADRDPGDDARDERSREDTEDPDAPKGRSMSVLIGSDTALTDRPATFRLGVQGEGRLLGGELASLSGVLPVTWMTSGQEQFGISSRQSVLEIPPSLRLRVFSSLGVRPYADVGAGLAFATRDEQNWLFEEQESTTGWMTRAALGLEIGEADGLMVVLEPSIQTYHLGESYARIAGMVGLGSRF